LVDPENPSEPSEDPKTLARIMLQEGADIEAIVAETSLSKPTVLGLKGALIKASKRLDKRLAAEDNAPCESLGKASPEEEIITDFKKETQVTNSALSLARSQQRLKSLDPAKYQELHGPGPEQAETSLGKLLTDIEFSRYLKTLREQESHPHQNNGDSGSSQAITELQKEFAEFREQMHKKEIEFLQKQSDKLEGQISDLRSDLRSSANSNSDLAVVVREGKDLLVQALQTSGPIRSYLVPSTNYVMPKEEAPAVHMQAVATPAPGQFNFLEEMRAKGLVTRIRDVKRGP